MITLCGFGVSNYYNKLKLVILEKGIPFEEKLVYPWESASFRQSSPMGKIPYIETEFGGLSESQTILEYLEDSYTVTPLYPGNPIERARCRELIQHLELNCEWVVRRLYKQAFFGGIVSEETKTEARERLQIGLSAVDRLAAFAPFLMGSSFTAADCAGFVHFTMIRLASEAIYGEDLLQLHLPRAAPYMKMMEQRPHVHKMMTQRSDALAAFADLNVPYDG